MTYHVSWGERPDGTFRVEVEHWYFTKTEDRDFSCVQTEEGIEHPFQAQLIAESLTRQYRAKSCQRSPSFSEIVHGLRMQGDCPGAYQVRDYVARAEADMLYAHEWQRLPADVYAIGLRMHIAAIEQQRASREEWLAEKRRKNRERMYDGRDD